MDLHVLQAAVPKLSLLKRLGPHSDDIVAWGISLAGSTLIAFALLPVIRKFLNYIANARFEREAMMKAATMRKGGVGTPVRVRQTDLIANMSAQDRQAFHQAEQLLTRGAVREAATIFEAIKFQRRAIDELEKAGLIDDACAVLLRMKLPNRAAVVYERHKVYDKAAHYYTEAGLHENTAKVLLLQAPGDARQYVQAGAAFERAGKINEAFDAYAVVLATEQLATLAAAHGLGDQLLSYAVDPGLIDVVHRHLAEDVLVKVIASARSVPRIARLLVAWAAASPSPAVTAEVFRKAAANPKAAATFWQAVTPSIAEQMRAKLASCGLEAREQAAHTLAMGQQEPAAAWVEPRRA